MSEDEFNQKMGNQETTNEQNRTECCRLTSSLFSYISLDQLQNIATLIHSNLEKKAKMGCSIEQGIQHLHNYTSFVVVALFLRLLLLSYEMFVEQEIL